MQASAEDYPFGASYDEEQLVFSWVVNAQQVKTKHLHKADKKYYKVPHSEFGSVFRDCEYSNLDQVLPFLQLLVGRLYDNVVQDELFKEKADLFSFDHEDPQRNLRLSLRRKDGTATDLVNPTELMTQVIASALKKVQKDENVKLTQCVACVMPYFDDRRRQATKDSYTQAGLRVLRIINSATSTSIAAGLNSEELAVIQKVVCLEVGLTSVEIALLLIEEGIFETIATDIIYNTGMLATKKLEKSLESYFVYLKYAAEESKEMAHSLIRARKEHKAWKITPEVASKVPQLKLNKLQELEMTNMSLEVDPQRILKVVQKDAKWAADDNLIIVVDSVYPIEETHLSEVLELFTDHKLILGEDPQVVRAAGCGIQATILTAPRPAEQDLMCACCFAPPALHGEVTIQMPSGHILTTVNPQTRGYLPYSERFCELVDLGTNKKVPATFEVLILQPPIGSVMLETHLFAAPGEHVFFLELEVTVDADHNITMSFENADGDVVWTRAGGKCDTFLNRNSTMAALERDLFARRLSRLWRDVRRADKVDEDIRDRFTKPLLYQYNVMMSLDTDRCDVDAVRKTIETVRFALQSLSLAFPELARVAQSVAMPTVEDVD